MLRFLPVVFLLGCIFHEAASQSIDTDPRDMAFTRITDDIHVAYRPEPLRAWVEGNVTIIINDSDVVVVDGSGSNRSARQVIEYIKAHTANPVSVLVNTHGHGDHTVGNSEYVRQFPGVEIIARPETYEYLTGKGIGYVAQIAESITSRKEDGQKEIAGLVAENAPEEVIANLRQYYEHDIDIRQAAYREAVIAPPTMTFGSGLTLHRPKRTIEILYLGPGDTHGDLVVFLPDDKLVATGDMVVHPYPYGFSRHAPEWLNTLDSLASLDFETLVPGHGAVLKGKAYLNRVRSMLGFVQSEVRAAIAEGLTAEQTAERIDLSAFEDEFAGQDPLVRFYFEEYFAGPNVQRTYEALQEGSESGSE